MSVIRLLTVSFTFTIAMLVLATGLGDPEIAHARNNFYATWDSAYPASISDDNVITGTGTNCAICHSASGGGNPWNAYGWDMRVETKAGSSTAVALANIEGLDSDGDGVSNIDEINAGTQPGWTNGNNNIFFFKNLSTTLNQPPPSPAILGDLDALAGVPGAPTGVTATTGDTQAGVAWTAPASDGGSAILDYTVTASPADIGPFTTADATPSATITGLTNGTTYTFTITARNANGSGPSSGASNSVTPSTVPDAPTGAAAAPGDTQADVSWTAPVSDGGSPILDYTVTSSPGGLTATSATSPATVTGLTNGTAYTFTVTARNANGSSIASTPSSAVTPSTVPGAPTGVAATPGDAQADVAWTAPASDGGSAILDYTVTSNPGGLTATSATSPATVTGLTNGTSYTFTVTARNTNGSGPSSTASNAVTPSTVPGTPTGVSATTGDTQADVSWTAPASDGGSPILDYTVTSNPGGLTSTSAASPTTVTGLTNGTSYTFTVTARNANGSSVASTASNAVTPSTIPGTPTAVTATAGDTQADVSWTAPASDGGSAILDYTVTSNPGGLTATSATSPATVTGLTNGTSYTFTVTARNTNGSGPSSTASNAVTPSTVPGTPTGVSATTGDTQANVFWTAPASDGGSPILDYTVTSSPGGLTATSATSPATVSGLTNGVSYTFTVTARNANGSGPASGASNSVTPFGLPDAPTGASATPGDTQATVTWTAPASDGGSAILDYTVTSNPGGLTATTPDGVTLNATVTGLTNGTPYTFTVTARNAAGSGPASGVSNSVTPTAAATAPGAPTGVTATAGDTQASLSWTAPASDGGSAILDYTVTSNPADVGPFTTADATPSATITGLSNGTAYTFTVTARNAVGTGPSSTASNSVTPSSVAGAPTAASATAGDTQADVSWTAPASDGGSPILDYTVTSSPGGLTSTSATSPATVSGLTNGVSYTFTVTARNANGSGPASGASNSVTPFGLPDAPTGASATPGDTQASVTWTAPASDGGSAILDYTVTSNPGGLTATTLDGVTLNATVTGLTNGTPYTFTVTARNAAGSGPVSGASNSVTPTAAATAPGAPTGVTATAGDTQASLSWTAPASDGGSAILDYTVTSSPADVGPFTTADATPSATITGLSNGTAYTFTVTARNAVGSGPPSGVSNSVTPFGLPDAPTGASATAGNTEATVTWTAPASDGGSAILDYTVTSSPGGLTATTPDGATLEALVTGLTNGIGYTFTVVATNANGDSLPSIVSNAVIPGSLPGSPTNIVATPGNTEASVTWDAPTSDGGSPITSYTVTSSPEAFTATTPDGATQTGTVVGLTNGLEYTFTVVATNANGDGLASVFSNPITPALAPNEPTNVVASAAHARASVTWTASTDDGGNAITNYTVTSSPDGLTATTLDGVTTTAIVLGLRNGVTYTFTVNATNEVGGSPASTASNATTPNVTWPATPAQQPPAHNFHAPYSVDTSSCAACHRVHTAPAAVAVQPAWPEETVCFTCHDGTAASNIDAQYAKAYRMPVAGTAGIHSMTEARDQSAAAFAGANRHVECQDCHNPHLAGQGTHPAGSNYAYGTEQGAWGLAVTNSSSWATPAMTPAYPITSQYEGCLKCHSSWAYGGSPPISPSGGYAQTDQALEFNTFNPSFHPVEDVGRNPFITWDGTSYASSLVGGFTPTSRMTCSDCHGSETPGDPAGPHGSTEPFVLTGGWDRTTGQTGTEADLCFSCHAFGTYGQGAAPTAPTGFSERTTTSNLHGFHVGIGNPDYATQAIGCMDCHAAVPHGFNRDGLLALTSDPAPYVDRPYSGGLIAIDTWEQSGQWEIGSCSTTCHPP
jgi:predicted CXXCH cytochrome family protein